MFFFLLVENGPFNGLIATHLRCCCRRDNWPPGRLRGGWRRGRSSPSSASPSQPGPERIAQRHLQRFSHRFILLPFHGYAESHRRDTSAHLGLTPPLVRLMSPSQAGERIWEVPVQVHAVVVVPAMRRGRRWSVSEGCGLIPGAQSACS